MKLLTTIHMARLMEIWRTEPQEVFEKACERRFSLDARGIFSVYASLVKTMADTGWTPDTSRLSPEGMQRALYLGLIGLSFAIYPEKRNSLYKWIKDLEKNVQKQPVYMMPSCEARQFSCNDELGLNIRAGIVDCLLHVELHTMVTDYAFDFVKNEYLEFPAQYGYPDVAYLDKLRAMQESTSPIIRLG